MPPEAARPPSDGASTTGDTPSSPAANRSVIGAAALDDGASPLSYTFAPDREPRDLPHVLNLVQMGDRFEQRLGPRGPRRRAQDRNFACRAASSSG